ncbi:MAG: hypothetical protein AWT59_0326 [Candidatus Gallionella acididurans]|uniref:Uncharacterized protein n=1 Tax=Candidatus Gallionella acididurans TaxID=1796491 RepID=A0A139BX75_9PROT|nr:MAG: hypothetical protein AWT59_0326 [Candidatus Gallionella acididurans]
MKQSSETKDALPSLRTKCGIVGAGHAREQKTDRGHGPLLQILWTIAETAREAVIANKVK